MSNIQLRSIARQVRDLNVAKEGFTSFFVDGENGADTFTGESWIQAFATIQHAVDTADSWSKIFVKSLANSLASANAAAAQPDVTVASSTGFTAGDVVVIKDDSNSERNTILSIAGNVLTMSVDLADPYTTAANCIVIHAYDENVVINKDHVRLIGEKKETTVVTDNSHGVTISGTGDTCEIEEFTAKTDVAVGMCIGLSGDNCSVHDCIPDASDVLGFGCGLSGDHCVAYRVYPSAGTYTGIITTGGNNGEIYDCVVDTCSIGISIDSDYIKVHDNTVQNCTTNITVATGHANNSIYHNNIINGTTQVTDVDGNSEWWENYYDDHTTDTNNDGLCDTPYTFTTGTDHQPVSRRNGWKQESLGATSSSAITIENIFSIVNALLTLTETGGTITTDGTEQNVYINNAPSGVFDPKIIQIDFTNHTATETVVIREYYRIKSGGGLIKKDERTFAGVQDPLLKNVTLEPNRFGVQVTIEKTVGTNRAYDYEAVYRI